MAARAQRPVVLRVIAVLVVELRPLPGLPVHALLGTAGTLMIPGLASRGLHEVVPVVVAVPGRRQVLAPHPLAWLSGHQPNSTSDTLTARSRPPAVRMNSVMQFRKPPVFSSNWPDALIAVRITATRSIMSWTCGVTSLTVRTSL